MYYLFELFHMGYREKKGKVKSYRVKKLNTEELEVIWRQRERDVSIIFLYHKRVKYRKNRIYLPFWIENNECKENNTENRRKGP
jgi:hypothetical protein